MPVKGKEAHIRRLRKLSSAEVVRVMEAVLYEGADMIKAEAQNSITRGSVSGKNHVASKPGEAPNNDTGDLRTKITAQRTGRLKAEVRSEARHASPLEFGTSKMAARPYMRPARDRKIQAVRDRQAEQMDKLVKRSGQ